MPSAIRSTATPQASIAPDPYLSLTDEGMESALLGGLIVGGLEAFKRVSHLTTNHFASRKNKLIWRVMQLLSESGVGIDFHTIKSKLNDLSNEKQNFLMEVGEDYLLSLVSQMGDAPDAYAKVLREVEWRRDTYHVLTNALKTLTDKKKPLAKLTEEIASMFGDVLMKSSPLVGQDSVSLADMLGRFNESYLTEDHSGIGIQTGFSSIDRAINGFERGRVYVFGGRTGGGKSIIGQNLAMNLARNGLRVVILAFDMPSSEYMMRAISIESSIMQSPIKKRSLNAEMIGRFNETMARLTSPASFTHRIQLVDLHTPTLQAVKTKLIELHHTVGFDAVVWDYMGVSQITADKQFTNNDTGAMSAISYAVKDVARSFNVVMIALAQLNRASEMNGGTPQLAWLFGSSSIEKDSDFVGILKDEAPYSETLGYGETDIHILKSRTGGEGQIIRLEARKAIFTFKDKRGL